MIRTQFVSRRDGPTKAHAPSPGSAQTMCGRSAFLGAGGMMGAGHRSCGSNRPAWRLFLLGRGTQRRQCRARRRTERQHARAIAARVDDATGIAKHPGPDAIHPTTIACSQTPILSSRRCSRIAISSVMYSVARVVSCDRTPSWLRIYVHACPSAGLPELSGRARRFHWPALFSRR